MKVCILGVARSGTTALYALMQEMLLDQGAEPVDFIYEPFLWDKDVFNGKYAETVLKFKYMDSVSIEGIYNHRKLPLFITDPEEFKGNHYLKSVLASDEPGKNVLAKFIRGNGRILLLNKICPDCKFIFVSRNPIDAVHSALPRFSFYGGEFHKDDFVRFIAEVNAIYNTSYSLDQFNFQVEREALFWFYMNRFCLEKIGTLKAKSIIICHEDYIKNRKRYIENICDFLNIEFKEIYYTNANKQVGPVAKKFELQEKDFEILSQYIEKYVELLNRFNIPVTFNKSDLTGKYDIIPNTMDTNINKFYGYTSIHVKQMCVSELRSNILLKERINKKEIQIAIRDDGIKRLRGELDEKANELKEKMADKKALIADRDNTIKRLKEKLNKTNSKLHAVEEKTKELKNIIKRKDEHIQKRNIIIADLKAESRKEVRTLAKSMKGIDRLKRETDGVEKVIQTLMDEKKQNTNNTNFKAKR